MQSYSIEKQKSVITLFFNLGATIRQLEQEQEDAWFVITSMILSGDGSKAAKQKSLLRKEKDYEKRELQLMACCSLYDLMCDEEGMYVCASDYKELLGEIDELIAEWIRMEEYEVAAFILPWRKKLPKR